MTPTTQRVLQEALQLPEEERADLAAQLIESLDPAVDEDVHAAWEAEIRKRLEELDQGTVKPVSWTDARRRIAGESP